jgi:hypothetical protein
VQHGSGANSLTDFFQQGPRPTGVYAGVTLRSARVERDPAHDHFLPPAVYGESHFPR